MTVQMTTDDLQVFLKDVFPQVAGDLVVEDVNEMTARVRLIVGDKWLRPGGTVSGPAMFTLADAAFYLGLLAQIGPQALAVTTNASLDFMRKPQAGADIYAQVRIHKLGRVLAVGDVLIYSVGMDKPVARASMTYSIPPK